MGKDLQQNQTSSTMQEISINYKEFDPSGEVLRQFFRYWNKTPSGLGSPLRRGVVP